MNLSWMWDLLGWAALPIVAVLLIILLIRRLVSEFPLFFFLSCSDRGGRDCTARVVREPCPDVSLRLLISDIVYTCFA